MNSVHPTAQLIGDVSLGTGNVVGPFAVLRGPLTLADDNWIGSGVVIGAPPEVRSIDHGGTWDSVVGSGVIIGNRNVIREGAQIHQGWEATTRVGDDAFIMNQCYVAHDCELENGVTMASSVLLGGHVRVGRSANLGLATVVHQRLRVGPGAMVGMGSVVTRDVLPFAKVYGNPASPRGANVIGMSRAGIPDGSIHQADALLRERLPDLLEQLAVIPSLESTYAGWRSAHGG